MVALLDVIQRVRRRQFNDADWLYIAGQSVDLTPATEADLGCGEFDEETDEEIAPPGFDQRGLRSAIDVETLSQCIDWADRLSECKDDIAAVDIIRYYIRFDAWPETLHATDPPPPEESRRRFYREFADQLGPEDDSRQCRREGCERGVVRFSVFCRGHHFESIQNCPYPFDD